jgi:hypothetical protein
MPPPPHEKRRDTS